MSNALMMMDDRVNSHLEQDAPRTPASHNSHFIDVIVAMAVPKTL